MKLYYSPVTCALSPYIVLLESGLDHELVVVDLKTHTLPDGADFYAINPLGYVPFLETSEGQRLAEGVAIIQYIADQAPEKQLAPA
ncbi:glutathione transferase GstA, partial [Pseudomonas avellanae]